MPGACVGGNRRPEWGTVMGSSPELGVGGGGGEAGSERRVWKGRESCQDAGDRQGRPPHACSEGFSETCAGDGKRPGPPVPAATGPHPRTVI